MYWPGIGSAARSMSPLVSADARERRRARPRSRTMSGSVQSTARDDPRSAGSWREEAHGARGPSITLVSMFIVTPPHVSS